MKQSKLRLNKIFVLQGKYWLLWLSIALPLGLSASEQAPQKMFALTQTNQDSLVVEKIGKDKPYGIKKGRQIKIWVGEETERGEFLGLVGDTLSIKVFNTRETIAKYNIKDIHKIKVFGNLVRQVLGGGLKIWGGAIVVAGFAPLIDWGPSGLLITIPAWIVGSAFYVLGEFLSGNRRFNFEKKWRIKE